LTHKMILALDRALQAWETDPDVACVILEGEGRAFCAKALSADERVSFTRPAFPLRSKLISPPPPKSICIMSLPCD
ncbi:enoyl-CoA hydratase/isomerase family protein, partial [Guyparkeria sp. 1SP6A2]|nr:enoyl-CoA hydratase/isomerase family protein [Guyparkeria sp. 1SP6A2]